MLRTRPLHPACHDVNCASYTVCAVDPGQIGQSLGEEETSDLFLVVQRKRRSNFSISPGNSATA